MPRGALCQPDYSMVGRVIGSPACLADEAAKRGTVDNGAAALGTHLEQLVFHAAGRTLSFNTKIRPETYEKIRSLSKQCFLWVGSSMTSRHAQIDGDHAVEGTRGFIGQVAHRTPG
jgi:hypothetical protein